MTNSQTIACIDGSELSTAVCDAAAWASLKMRTPLVLLHSLEKPVNPDTDNLSGSIGLGSREQLLSELTELDEQRSQLALKHGRTMLENAKQRAIEDGVEDIQLRQRHGDVLESLLELEDEARLIVIGRSGEGHLPDVHIIGSHAESAARSLHQPLLISVGHFAPPEHFMIAFDGRVTAERALAKIAASPLLKGIQCSVVMVGTDNAEQRQKLTAAEDILVKEGFSVRSTILQGEIFTALKSYQEENNIDLIAMGAYSHSKTREFFVGSTTTRMISGSDVPLLIIR